MTTTAPRVPAALQEKFEAIALTTDAFCNQHLNDEYKQLIRQPLAALSRKRPSPLLKGQETSWPLVRCMRWAWSTSCLIPRKHRITRPPTSGRTLALGARSPNPEPQRQN